MPGRRRERKIVTVVFADLVGFTSRAETLDPEDVEAILEPYHERLRSELERHGGTVEKFIGDAVMAVFGAPTVHEDDAERAVRAALAIRDAIIEDGTLEVRVGVNTGEALVNLDARPETGKGMVAGDVVNTGARLQAAAPTNGVLVGEATYRATQHAIDYRAHAPVDAKGKTEPVGVWEAVDARSRVEVEVQRPPTPLVGRERELDALIDALTRARNDRSAQLVTLVGEPGIGKSRLIYELFTAVEADQELIWWRHGRSLPYGEGISFWALGQIVKAQAGILGTDPPEAARDKLRAAVAAMDDADWLVSHLSPLVGLGGDGPSGADARSEAFSAWRRFFEDLAEQRPLVLVFEDLHWADDGLLDFVDHLVDWATGVPILVVASARPELLERRPGWGGGKRNAITISLTPLAETDVARLLAALLDTPVLPADTQARLLQQAGGNPLYAEEFARMLADRREHDKIPETLHGMIAARLDTLMPSEKALLQDAAVVGRVFWSGALAAMGGATQRDLDERLHGLERREFVRRERRSSLERDSEYTFLHVLMRDVAYGQIPRADRAAKHERAALWLEQLGRSEDSAEMLAHHYLQALEYAGASGRETAALEEPARRAFAEAGDRALALNALPTAIAYYERALVLWSHDDPERWQLLVQRGNALLHQRGSDAAEPLEQTLADLARAEAPEARAEVAALLAWSLWQRGDTTQAVETLSGVSEELADAASSRAKAVVLQELARLRSLAFQPSAVETAQHAIEAARAVGARDVEARALNTLGVARFHSGDGDGLVDVGRSLALAEEITSSIDIIRAHLNLASLNSTLGELAKCWDHARTALALAERWGLESPLRWMSAELVEDHYYNGRWGEARQAVDAFLAEVEAGSPHYLEGPSRIRRSLLRLACGDLTGALADDEKQVALARQVGDRQNLEPSLGVSAFVRAEAGDLGAADARLDKLMALFRDGRGPAFFAPAAELVFAAVARGYGDELLAVRKASASTRWSEAAAVFARGEYSEAADLYAEIGAKPGEAYARLAAGDGANVRRALAFYRSVGATFYIKRAEALLPASA